MRKNIFENLSHNRVNIASACGFLLSSIQKQKKFFFCYLKTTKTVNFSLGLLVLGISK